MEVSNTPDVPGLSNLLELDPFLNPFKDELSRRYSKYDTFCLLIFCLSISYNCENILQRDQRLKV